MRASAEPSAVQWHRRWRFITSRFDLAQAEEADLRAGAPWPLWATRLRGNSSGQTLIDAIDAIVGETLTRSSARADTPPLVRIPRLARALGVDIQVVTPKPALDIASCGSALPSGCALSSRGTIVHLSPRVWRVVVTQARQCDQRISVAHELSHLLLYSSAAGVDRALWRTDRPSRMEEALCDYSARALLAPSQEVLAGIRVNENAAVTILRLAEHFSIPIETAAVRWMDCAISAENNQSVKIVLWRQQHPLSPSFIRSCLDAPLRREYTEELARQCREVFARLPRDESWRVWSDLRDIEGRAPGSGQGWLFVPGFIGPVEDLIRRLRAILSGHGAEVWRGTLDRLADRRGPHALCPMWAAGRAALQEAFIPLRRGAAKPGSVVALAAGYPTDEGKAGDEEVRIGALQARCRTYASAFVDPVTGVPSVLAVYFPLEDAARRIRESGKSVPLVRAPFGQ